MEQSGGGLESVKVVTRFRAMSKPAGADRPVRRIDRGAVSRRSEVGDDYKVLLCLFCVGWSGRPRVCFGRRQLSGPLCLLLTSPPLCVLV